MGHRRAAPEGFAGLTGAGGLTYQPGLDGIRGLAVAAVVAFHLGFERAGGGYLGVSLFFTLSGFLIGTLVLDEVVRTGGFSLAGFWRRRARRLLPPALLTLAAVAVARLLATALSSTSRGDLAASAVDVANWHFLVQGTSYADLFGGPSAVLHFWSLAIEQQFYLVAGLLAVLLARRARRPVLAVFVAAVAASLASFVVPIAAGAGIDRVYYGSDTRAGELLVGVAAAAVFVSARRRHVALRHRRALAATATIALAATVGLWATATAGSDWLRRGLLPLTALCSLLLIVGALLPAGPVAVLLRARPLVWLGGISYALYLVHWPVIVVADQFTASRSWARAVVVVAVSVTLARLCAFAVERPVRVRRLDGRPLALAAAAVVTVVGVAAVVDGRSSQSAALLEGLAAATPRADEASAARGGGGTPRVALFGDSVGFSLLLALGAADTIPEFERVGSDVAIGCGIAVSPSPPADDPHRCDDPAGRFAAKAAAGGVTAAVMISCQWELVAQPLPGRGDRQYALGNATFDRYVWLRYEEVAERLTAAGVDRVLWVTCPYLSTTVGAEGLSPGLAASRDPRRVERLNAIVADLAASRDDVELLPFGEWVNERVDDETIRPDGSHFEYREPNPAADAFVDLLNAAL